MNPFSSSKRALLASAVAGLSLLLAQGPAHAADEQPMLQQDSRAALASLYAGSPGAKALSEKAKGILVFPNIVKAGFVVGAQSGDGMLLEKDKPTGYYNTTAVSVGMQAGAQSFGYVLFFMSDPVLAEFKKSKNFKIGVGPTIVVIDAGAAKDVNRLTVKSDVYAIIFDQKGLMAGLGLQGSKITRLDP